MTESLLERANALLRAGKPGDAAALARELLTTEPRNAEALNTLGTALAQQGDAGAERAWLDAAAADTALYKPHANLATLYVNRGRADLAVPRLEQAVRLAPSLARLWARLGELLLEAREAPRARHALERAVEIEPTALHRSALARVLVGLGEAAAAVEVLGRADLGEAPEAWAVFAEACNEVGDPRAASALARAAVPSLSASTAARLALVAVDVGAPQTGVVLARAARQKDPARVSVELEAMCLEAAGDAPEAVALIEAAFDAAPSVAAIVLLADVAQRTGVTIRAGVFEAARVLFPDSPDLLVAWGRYARSIRDYDAALTAFEQAAKVAPDHPGAAFGLGVAEASITPSTRSVELLERACALSPADPAPHSALLFAELHAGVWSPEERLEKHRRWARRFGFVGRHVTRPRRRPASEKLRVGYLSADFRDHAVARFLAGVLGAHDRGRFEVFLYGSVVRPDRVTDVFRGQGHAYRDLRGVSDEKAAQRIAADDLDVLVSIDGHTAASRLRILAYRPAPVQVSYLGYPTSLGFDAIDYRVTDAIADPPGAEADHTEVLVRLPNTAWCFDPVTVGAAPADMPRDREGDTLPIVWSSFNRSAKLSDAFLACVRRILEGAPSSRFLLKAPASESRALRARVAAALGSAADRVEMVPWTDAAADHLATYRRVDVALDTFPYAGTTTTAEALWMGVPVVTLAGRTHVERVGASLVGAVGLDDLIATTPDAYVEAALRLGADRQRLAALRRELPVRVVEGPLGDPRRFAGAWEACLTDLAARPRREPDLADTWVVKTDQGAKLVVPDSLDIVTTFVVQEQRRWFEEEVPFVRRLVEPGDVVVDVGANLGLYTIEAARLAGPGGRVVSFEPSSSTAAMLRASVALNDLDNVVIHQVALGHERGEARLQIAASPELSQLGSAAGPSETVALEPLDTFESEVRGMRFLKLDAEGSEEDILRAAGELVAREAPVVMFELRHAQRVNTGLLGRFRDLGFDLYRLCPGPSVLIPFEDQTPDGFLLNLFAVRPEAASALEGRGLLVRSIAAAVEPASEDAAAKWVLAQPLLRSLSFARPASRAVRCLLRGIDTHEALGTRCAALFEADREARLDLARGLTPTARLTAARAALEIGHRSRAVDLMRAIAVADAATLPPPSDPFVCALHPYLAIERFDPARVYRAQAIEITVRLGAFSSFYQPPNVLQGLYGFFADGGESDEMDRRLGLLTARAGAHR